MNNDFKKASAKDIVDITRELHEQGVSDEILEFMSAYHLSKINMPSNSEIIRKAFPLQELPRGAYLIYDKHVIEPGFFDSCPCCCGKHQMGQ